MFVLALSLLALPVGPLCVALLAGHPTAFIALDAFVVVAITGLVMLHIVPESIAQAGWPALVALIVGLGLPALLHGAQGSCHSQKTSRLFTAMALGALALHALLDGVGLVPRDASVADGYNLSELTTPLAVSVVLHRLMEGVGVWWLAGAHATVPRRLAALSVVGVMTLLGFAGGSMAVEQGALNAIACVQTMVAGSLLHVLMRHGPHAHGHIHPSPKPQARDHSWATQRWASCLGGAVGILLLAGMHVVEGAHHHDHHHAHEHLHGPAQQWSAWELLQVLATGIGPAVLWALLAAATMHMVVPKWHSAMRGVRPAHAALLGTVQGLLLAPCSCGVVPLYRRLLANRASDAQALAYLLAAPGLGLVTLAVSWAILGPYFLMARVAGAIVISGTVALLTPGSDAPSDALHALEVGASETPHDKHKAPMTWALRCADGLAFALGEVADFTGPWLLFGLVVAALCAESVNSQWLLALDNSHLTIPVMAALALPLYMCGSASTLVAAVLMAKGLHFGGALTFVWAASMLSPAALSAIRQRYGRKKAVCATMLVALAIMAAGALATFVPANWQAQDVFAALFAVPATSHVTAAACALWVLLAWAIARQGVREAVDQIALLNRDGRPSHHHGGH